MIVEALCLFCFPFLSHPRAGHLDEGTIKFLQANVGLRRVVETNGPGIGANFGSYFGIATLNYGDLPVPQRTITYLQKRLDSYAGSDFVSSVPPLVPAKQREREAILRERLPLYGAAGVKYLLAPADFNAASVFEGFSSQDRRPNGLLAGQTLEISAQRGPATESAVVGLTVVAGTMAIPPAAVWA
jgi:hypothetical protein